MIKKTNTNEVKKVFATNKRDSKFVRGVTFKEAPAVSEKRRRFLDNIEARMERALEKIRLVKQCFHPGNYEWTEVEGLKVIEALEEAVKSVSDAVNRRNREKKGFKL